MLEFANELERSQTEAWWEEIQISLENRYHLTLTGYYAGTPLCGVNKQRAIELGDKFVHAAYAPLDNPDINFCFDCVEVWNSTDDAS